jgi:hypothetical protein
MPKDTESTRRLRRLAKRAKVLDDMIVKAARMQKEIVEELERVTARDQLRPQRITRTPKPRKLH